MASTRIAQVSNLVNRMLAAVAVLFLLLLMAHTLANAVLRYAANSPITGTNEYVAFWHLPMVALLGFYFAQRQHAHIEARLVFDRLPLANRIEFQLLGQVLTIALCIGFANYGWVEAMHAYHIGLTGGATGVVIWPALFMVPFAFGLLALQFLLDAIAVIRMRDPDATPRGHLQPDDAAAIGD